MKVVVIGGGAAGMMAAIAAAQNGASVTLLEKNEKTGKKIYITGKGRCNVTNNCDPDTFFASVISHPKFLYPAYSVFDCKALMELIENNHTPLKTERGGRVFPVSDHSYDIIDALKRAMSNAGVRVRLHTEVSGILTKEYVQADNATDVQCAKDEQRGHNAKASESVQNLRTVCGVICKEGERIPADRVILATGGLSYPSTGSTGDGYAFAEALGHTVTQRKPSLVPLTVKETWVPELQGLSLKNVTASLYLDGKRKYSDMGEMLFTHFGISGPLILTASSYLAAAKEYRDAYIILDMKPALTDEEFDKRLIRELEAGNRKELKNILGNLYPSKFAGLACELAGVDPYRKCNEVSAKERKALLDITKHLKMTITGTRDYNEAIITHGGVNVKEVNPKTMESKKVKGLYLAGELLDVDAKTGGFNLQIAFSTGYLAGMNASET